MAKYQLAAPAFIDGAFCEAGTEIDYEGIPGPHMRPLDKAAEKAAEDAKKPRAASDAVFTGFSGFPELPPPVNVDVPHLQPETANVGETLTCTMGIWEGEPTSYAYAWVRDSEQLGSGPANTYDVTTDDVGHEVTCIVTATNPHGSTAAPPSNAVLVTAPARKEEKKR